MAKKKVLIASVPNLVFKSIWFVFAAVFFGIGLGFFLNNMEQYGFLAWLGAGGICCVPVLADIIKMVLDAGKEGARKGANDYTVTVTSSSVRVRNHPVSGFIFGILGGLIGSALIGLVYLGIKLIICLIEIIRIVVYLIQHRKKTPSKSKTNTPKNKETDKGHNKDLDEDHKKEPGRNQNKEQKENRLPNKDEKRDLEEETKEENIQYEEPKFDMTLINELIEAKALELFDSELSILNDRYELLGEKEINIESKEPIKLTGYQILKDSISERKILRLSAVVNNDIEIKKICLNITPIDNDNRVLGQIKNLEYDVKLVKKDDKFLANYGVILPDETTLGEINIAKVIFSDELYWNKTSVKYSFISKDKIEHDLGL